MADEPVFDANGWATIDNAPDDLRSVLAYHRAARIAHVSWRSAVGSDRYLRFGEREDRGWRPTHWRPLPKPPVGT